MICFFLVFILSTHVSRSPGRQSPGPGGPPPPGSGPPLALGERVCAGLFTYDRASLSPWDLREFPLASGPPDKRDLQSQECPPGLSLPTQICTLFCYTCPPPGAMDALPSGAGLGLPSPGLRFQALFIRNDVNKEAAGSAGGEEHAQTVVMVSRCRPVCELTTQHALSVPCSEPSPWQW